MMTGILYDLDIESIEKLKEQYKEKLEEIRPKFNRYEDNKVTLIRNINIFEKVLREKKQRKIKDNFKLKKEHLELLKNLNFSHLILRSSI